jgi:hypothetical protein
VIPAKRIASYLYICLKLITVFECLAPVAKEQSRKTNHMKTLETDKLSCVMTILSNLGGAKKWLKKAEFMFVMFVNK